MGLRRNFITGEWEEYEGGTLNGRWVHRDGEVVRADSVEWAPAKSSRSAICSKNPLVSKAMGVIPSQAKEFNEAARRNKTGAYYDPKTGNPQFTSRQSRAKEMAARHMFDRQGGYGDRMPNHQ